MFSKRFLWIGASVVVTATIALAWVLMPHATTTRITPTHTISAGGVEIKVEIVDTPESRAQGLSGTTVLLPEEGMLFVFETDGKHSFWMKDMLIPIDIIWADVMGSVVHIERSLSPDSYPQSFTPALPARYVLEVPAGFATEHGIEVGSKLQNLPIDSL